MTKDEALKMAIETFEFEGVRNEEGLIVLNACKEALEQPPQGIELDWYVKGWDDAKRDLQALKEKNT